MIRCEVGHLLEELVGGYAPIEWVKTPNVAI